MTEEVATKLARRLNLENPYKTTSSNYRSSNYNEIEWVEVIDNGENSAGFYVINFENDGGFVILSGDYRTVPIFAVSSSGSFPAPGDTIDQGMAMMIDEAMDHLIYTRDTVDLPSIPEDILQLWSGAGVYSAITPPSGCDCNAPNLDWMCIEQCEISGGGGSGGGSSSTSVSTFGPLMTTEWGQDGTFNNSAPIVNFTCQALTGCVATAMAQLMRYHEHPTNYNWTSMQNTDEGASSSWGTRANLLRDCGDAVDMNWGCESSSAIINKAKKALRDDFGYSSSIDYVNYHMTTAKGNILGYKPVILTGCRTREKPFLWYVYSDCHAWVADGVRTTTITTASGTSNSYEIYMNWGWAGVANSWFTDFAALSNRNYQFNKKMIKNIYPN